MGSVIKVLQILISLFLCSTFSYARYLDDAKLFREVKRLSHSSEKSIQPEKETLFFKKGGTLPKATIGAAHNSIVLECQAGGKPTPTIFWRRNKIRIQQGPTRDYNDDELIVEETLNENERIESLIGLGFTGSKLYLDCLTPEDAALYTCVAKTGTLSISSNTSVSVVGDFDSIEHERCIVKKSIPSNPARIYQWTSHRVEVSGASVQLVCRAEGSPTPSVKWTTQKGEEITDLHGKYKVLGNGDLLIHNISWRDMGSYTCTVSNEEGSDQISTFLYPTRRS